MKLILLFAALCLSIQISLAQGHTYVMNGDLTETNGGPALTQILSCGAGI